MIAQLLGGVGIVARPMSAGTNVRATVTTGRWLQTLCGFVWAGVGGDMNQSREAHDFVSLEGDYRADC